MRRTIRLWSFALIYVALAGPTALSQNSQSYLNDIGSTSYGVNIPVENGFINVSNGNLHLEFPLATHSQRGALKLNERIVYDSRIWMFSPFGSNSTYHWWPYNVPGSDSSTNSGGWRFLTGAEIGTVQATLVYASDFQCPNGIEVYSYQYSYSWTDPNGTTHPFGNIFYLSQQNCGQVPPPNPESATAYATDASGYQITLIGDDQNGPSTITIRDNTGTQVYPQVTDRFGNYWSSDSNGNLIDDSGRTPVIVTTNGNVTYYDVLAPNGPINNNGTRVRYTVTNASVPVATNFQQSNVYEWNPSTPYLTPVQSIALPDGSQYSFTYDGYGELASVTLPTGGVIQYGYTNFVDSSNTANRWLSSRTQGSNPPMTFTPSVATTCVNYSTGCIESVNLHKPSGDETVYQLTLINGAWNTGVTTYTGSAASGQTLSNTTSVNQYSNGCSNSSICFGANYLNQSVSTTVLYANGSPSVSSQSQVSYNPFVAKTSAFKEWDYGANFSGTPTRETDYTYAGVDLQQVTLLSNGNQAGQTTYAYTSSATTTSGVAQHGTVNVGGPYLQSVSRWLNTGNPSITTYAMDDTGQVLSTQDPNQNPPANFSYQCANSLLYQATNPLNQTTTYGFDCSSGAITSVRDPNDVAAGRSGTTYAYEGTAGRLQSVSYPDGGQTSYGYPSSTEVDTTVLATPSPSISSQDIADSFGRHYQHIQAGVSGETTYDSNGRVACVTNPHFTNSSSSTDGSTCISSYDGLDRPLVQLQPDGNTLQWSYPGNSTTSTDEAGNQWVRTANAFGVLTNVVEPTGASTSYTYDGLSNLATVTQSGVSGETPRVRSFVYDSLSRLTSATSPESGTVNYNYYANGNLHQETDARGIWTAFAYDALNRLTDKYFNDGLTPNQHFQYDQTSVWMGTQFNTIGRLSRTYTDQDRRYYGSGSPPACNPQSSSTANYNPAYGNPVYCEWTDELYSYDAMGRQTRIGTAFPSEGGWNAHETDIAYDLAGNMTSLRYPDGRVITQSWDGAGHQQTSTFDNWNGQHVGYTYASGLTYTPAGSQAEITFGNGVYIHTPYNNRLQMCQVWAQNSIQPLIDTHIYFAGNTIYCGSTPGNNGNITQIKDWRNPNRTRYFGYDALNRINAFWNGDNSMNQNYSYDSFGNMSQSGTLNFQGNYTASANNQVNLSGYNYDVAGNLVGTNNGVASTFSFDAESKLFSVNSGGGYYTYDAAGERMRKDSSGVYTEYQYLNGQVIAEKNADGSWSDYIYANGQLIARADSFDARIHVHGTTPGGKTTSWLIGGGGYVIKPNDKLYLRQFQYQGFGGPNIVFTDGTQTYQNLVDSSGQAICALQTEQQWVNRSFDLSSFAGKTILGTQVVTDYSSPTGTYDIYYGEIAIVSSDDTVTPIYVRQLGSTFTNVYNEGQTNLSAVEEASNYTGDSVQGPTTTTYYVGDQVGSTRMLASAGGWPMSSTTFYPFGQEQSPATDPNHYRFTGLERDSESGGLDHAMFRQYSSSMGRWMSPDPYHGSMDLANPQSLNRYSYVANSPLTSVDPSGLVSAPPNFTNFSFTNVFFNVCGGSQDMYMTWAPCGLSPDGASVYDKRGVPQQQGSADPRSNTFSMFHPNPYSSLEDMIGDILGLSGAGCEFGACGFQQGGTTSSVASYADDFGQILLFAPRNRSTPLRLFGSRFCGPGGAGTPNSHVDGGCQVHDKCFDDHGINFWGNIVPGLWSSEQKRQAQTCNQTLYNTVRQYPNEPGSKPIQNWLKYGDWFGILGWNTNVH